MTKTGVSFLAAAVLAGAGFGFAPGAHAGSSADYFQNRASSNTVSSQLGNRDENYYRDVFAAIHAEQWDRASALLAERDGGLLHDVAKAELYLAANSPRVELGPLLALLTDAAYLPQAEQLGRLAARRGATILPSTPQMQQLASFGGLSRRGKPRPVSDYAMPETTASAILESIKNDDPQTAAAMLASVEGGLSDQARTEWRQRVAWSYYIENNDSMALDMAERATERGSGEWLAEAHWVAGLAAWRLNDCKKAADAFYRTATSAPNEEMRAAGYYWAARANMKCRAPQNVQTLLRGASGYSETLYGILAAESLGLDAKTDDDGADFTAKDWKKLHDVPNVRIAIALTEIGEDGLADEVLRHQARIGDADNYAPMLRLARDLSLPSAQIYMAHNGPSGARPESFARFPSPKWKPVRGWRVDPALVYAHTLQESGFRTTARSAADARGLMQVRPGSAGDVARARGEPFNASDLYRPDVNLEYGQSYLEYLKSMPQTQGLLPKVIAAYNAGPVPVDRWNSEVRDNGDPLLFIESIPYYETRAYVGIILRNYWMYENQAKVHSDSAMGLAQGLWPRFPGVKGTGNVRLSYNGAAAMDSGYHGQ